jgi:molecular chaperone GrpE
MVRLKIMKDDQKNKKQVENKEVEELKQKVEDFEGKYKRALADYQNLEKRIKEERIEWIKSANKELILELLPVLDTLLMVNEHVKDEGLALNIKQFLDILSKQGLERIETSGLEFNPQYMECIGVDQGEEGKVITETRTGYKINGKILRPAMVKVGKSSYAEVSEDKGEN